MQPVRDDGSGVVLPVDWSTSFIKFMLYFDLLLWSLFGSMLEFLVFYSGEAISSAVS